MYTTRKRAAQVLDFDDLLLCWQALFDAPGAGEQLRGRFDHVLVDEYQDTNALQADLLAELAAGGARLTAVGDDAQAIYGFRAADVRNILDFPARFGSDVVRLEQSQRSTPPLVAFTNAVIAEAPERHEKRLWSARAGAVRPALVTCADEGAQSAAVCERLLDHVERETPLRSQAVLVRTGHHSDRVRRWLDPHVAARHGDAAARLADLDRLTEAAAAAPSLGRFLVELALDPPASTGDLAGPPSLDDDVLTVSTIHSAKGLEWDVVHVLHLADGSVPSDMATGDADEIEEERRLLYVALTRARDGLYGYVPLRSATTTIAVAVTALTATPSAAASSPPPCSSMSTTRAPPRSATPKRRRRRLAHRLVSVPSIAGWQRSSSDQGPDRSRTFPPATSGGRRPFTFAWWSARMTPIHLDRRRFLGLGAAGIATLATARVTPAGAQVVPGPGPAAAGPFTLGVASGDPTPGGVVLWTRLAPDPLNGGGMGDQVVMVDWEVAEDEAMQNVVARGTEPATPQLGHSVHAEVTGLRPGAWYWYRFKAGSDLSPVGRTRTAPALGAAIDRLAFALTSCQIYDIGFYTAHRHMAGEDLDLVIQVGDYIYEGIPVAGRLRPHEGTGEPVTLVQYRNRYGQYKGDADLQASHAAFPWAVVLDDHEIDNNWADEVPQDPAAQPRDAFLARRAAAFQAYYEHMPLRRSSLPSGIDISLYRRLTFGDLVDVHLLDTRQYRSDQDGTRRAEPTRTILGDDQERWLQQSLAGPTARWNVLAQQVFFSQRDFTAGVGTSFSDDAWDGYVADRDSLRDHIAAVRPSNPVVLTGDVHANYVCDVKENFNDPASRTVATELVGTSITTGGNGMDQGANDGVQLAENPHIKFINRNRGYVRNVITRSEWTADFRVVDFVTTPGAPVRTRASFVIENGRAGAQRTDDPTPVVPEVPLPALLPFAAGGLVAGAVALHHRRGQPSDAAT